MDIIKAVLWLILGPVFILFPIWMGRRKSCPNFNYWMETEGAPILGRLIVIGIIFLLVVSAPILGLIVIWILFFADNKAGSGSHR